MRGQKQVQNKKVYGSRDTSVELSKEIGNLEKKMSEMKHKFPIINPLNQVNGSRRKVKRRETNSKRKSKKGQKLTIKWNHSAISWTRDVSPSYLIPKGKRFQKSPKKELNYQTLYGDLRQKLSSKGGVTFAKSTRRNLFPCEANPSPSQYCPKRYLQGAQTSKKSSRILSGSQVSLELSPSSHIKGGAINKFTNYHELYYPQAKKLNYNEKELEEEKRKKKQFQIRLKKHMIIHSNENY